MLKRLGLLALYEMPVIAGYWFVFVYLEQSRDHFLPVVLMSCLLIGLWLSLGLRLGLRILGARSIASGEKMMWMYSLLLTYPLAVLALFATRVGPGGLEV